ncbi:hypothetical protein EJ03DRAFT_338855 [Teratosphaeria nubilosa]|uniref:Uncharacterized protein n=1 Tax=Teratosphaeria nubilosa TaxID=161662 RepID=A0A6G1L0E4_9PEZI|nr:hypothetical protein EJ03DRAFT_338855 [Teratosphaeria nubilosa]
MAPRRASKSTKNLPMRLADLRLDSPMTTTTKAPVPNGRANLPLPRQLRARIYEFLLSGEHARLGPRTYRFKTAILRVSHEIHMEAMHYLYEHNDFVMVTFQLAQVGLKYSHLIPKVCTYQILIQRMRHLLPMHVNLTCELPAARIEEEYDKLEEIPLEEESASGVNGTDIEPPYRGFLMLAKDLPTLCLVFQLKLLCFPETGGVGQVLFVLSKPGESLQLGKHGKPGCHGQPAISLELRSPKYRKMSLERQQCPVDPLKQLIGESMKFIVTGVEIDSSHIISVKRTISPSLVWAAGKCGACTKH